jgi:hypothetical protein
MAMQAMDKILDAADPVNRAQRQNTLRNLQYETQYGMPLKEAQAKFELETGIPLREAQAKYERDVLPYRLEMFRKYGFEVKSPRDVLDVNKVTQQNTDRNNFNNLKNPGGGATGGPSPISQEERSQTPPYLRWPPPSQKEINQWHQDNGTVEPTQIGAPEPVTYGPTNTPIIDYEPPVETQPSTQTISGGNVTDDQGNVLPPAQQGEEGVG